MSVNKDIFDINRDFNYDFESNGPTPAGWRDSDRVPEKLIPTHCCFCGVQCGMNIKVSNGQVIGVEPRDYVHNRGNMCPKGVVAYQQVNHPERLRYPMMRKGGKGSPLERVSWDEALNYVVSRWQDLQNRYGKDAVAVYSGSSMTNEKCYLTGKFARVGLQTRHIDYNGRLCMSSAAGGQTKAFGIDRAPMPMTDIPKADCIFIAGSNVAECFPIVMRWIWQARDRGARLIVMDPRETPIARTADLWLPVKPGMDVAVFNAILRYIIHEGLVDEAYVAARTNGWEAVKAVVEPFTFEYAQELSGIPAERLLAAAQLYGRAATSLILHARGIEHHTHGVNNVSAAINLGLARGQFGKPGGGVMTLTGQGNGQGGREHGQKANQLPGYRHIDMPTERQEVADVWGIPVDELPWEGAAATEMVHLMADGEIKSCLILCSNLMVSLPDNKVVQRALDNLDPLVVIDFFMSETAERADVVLPGSVWCEDEGTTTNLEGRVIKINKAADPPGEARTDWAILCDIAARLGRARYFPFKTAREIWDELRRASRGGMADYYGITWEKIDRQQGVFWPCPTLDHPGTPLLYADRFYHPDGKARFTPVEFMPPVEEPSKAFPFRLTSGRVVYHYLSGAQTRRLGFLNSQAPEPWVEINPQAAARLGIVDNEIVRVRTTRASMELKALVVPTIRPDTLFIPFHYGHEQAVNQLTIPAVDPNVKIPEYKVCAAVVEKLDARPPSGDIPQEPKINYTPATNPKMFPYAVGETKARPEEEGKRY
ncbi:MAG TPA: molybdopterin oxidoreductase family protein [Chloroflexia bacterium]|nr:molybdopterin oxidoreductase family protein [Chloroflexia bacterium]